MLTSSFVLAGAIFARHGQPQLATFVAAYVLVIGEFVWRCLGRVATVDYVPLVGLAAPLAAISSSAWLIGYLTGPFCQARLAWKFPEL